MFQTLLSRANFLTLLAGLSGAGTLWAGGTSEVRRRPVIYLATYSHVDPDWLWPFQEGEQQADSTFRSVLNILDQFRDLKFSMTGAAHYRWVRETDPETFQRIKRAVARGQWEPLGGWWVEADTNVPSGESLMRQGLYGQREFMSAFGVRSKVACLPDSFGSSANLPAILRAQGLSAYIMRRGYFQDGSSPPPDLFVWHGLGNSSIVTYRLPLWNGSNDVLAKVREVSKLALREPPLVLFGLGDHGGGPSRAAMEQLRAYRATAGALDLKLSRVDDYFASQPTPKLELAGELEGDLPGGYANAAQLKQADLEAERALIDTERFDVMAYLLLGDRVPAPQLDNEWQTLLLHQYHDTIAGTAVRQSTLAATEADRAVATRCRERRISILERIVDAIDHRDAGEYMLAVFNPLDHPQTVPVTYTVGAGAFSHDPDQTLLHVPDQFLDARGNDLPWQYPFSDDGAFSGAIHPILFSVRVPAFGYTTVRMRSSGRKLPSSAPPKSSSHELSNERLIVKFDEDSGQPSSIIERRSGRELLRRACRLVVFRDRTDTWGRMQMPIAPDDEMGSLHAKRVTLVEDGPVRGVMRAALFYESSTVNQNWSLYAGESVLRSVIHASWHEPQTRFGFSMTPAFQWSSAEYDVPFGRVKRHLDDQLHPASSSVLVSSDLHSIAVISAGSRAYWASRSSIGVNLLRAVPYVWNGETKALFAEDQLQDVGDQRLVLAIDIGTGDARSLAQTSEALDRTFPVTWIGIHQGRAPSEASFASIDPGVTLPSTRRTADGRTILARIHDVTGGRHATSVALRGHRWTGVIDAFGVTTVKFDRHRAHEILDIQ